MFRSTITIVMLAFIGSMASGLMAQTKQITTFDDLMQNLKQGEQVRVVIHYNKCTLITDGDTVDHIPDAISGMEIGTFEYFAPMSVHNKLAFVVFSSSVLIENPIGKGYVINYGKVRVRSDQSVEVIARYLHPRTNKILMDERFIGKMNDGKGDQGIYFYQ
jgi:hypothetical protein